MIDSLRAEPYHTGVAGVVALFLLRLVFAASLVPPWQNPDEPQHFAIIRALAKQSDLDLANRRDLAVEAEVLVSMAAHRWWQAYDEPTPSPLPGTFDDAPEHLNDASDAPVPYYAVMSRLCRVLGLTTIESQYYALRIVSILISLGTMGAIIAGTRVWFGSLAALVAGALVALVPQFALIAIAVSPDTVVNLCGAIIWWYAGRLYVGHGGAAALAIIGISAIVALLIKRIAAPMLLQAGVLAVAAAFLRRDGRPIVRPAFFGAFIVGIAGAVVLLRFFRPEDVDSIAAHWTGLMPFRTSASAMQLPFFVAFTVDFFWSAYLAGGWLRFWAPQAIALAAIGLVLFAMIRAAVLSIAERHIRRGAIVGLFFIVTQLVAVYAAYYSLGAGAQGRFLFPVIAPLAGLAAVGLTEWQTDWMRAIIPATTVGLLAILDFTCWTLVIIQPYAP